MRLKYIHTDRANRQDQRTGELKITFLRNVMNAIKQVMLCKGMDPMIMSIYGDLINLEKKMVHRRKHKQKLTNAEVALRRATLDKFLQK